MHRSPTNPASKAILGGCSAFARLLPTVLDDVFACMEQRTYEADEVLIRQGDPGDCLFAVLAGQARAVVHRDDGTSHEVGRFGPGEIVGEMALLTREPRNAEVIAVSSMVVLALPAGDFHRIAGLNLDLCMVLTNVVADRLGQEARDGLGGKVFNGYRISRCVGRGGMAVVYDATEQLSGRRVALKMMSHRLVYAQSARERFRQEAEIVQTLDHENIARLYSGFPAYLTHFLVMEFCDGSDLGHLVQRGGTTERSARKILGQLARALNYVHERGVIHRDIKPSNAMLNRDGTVKLMDFGLAIPALDDLTRTYATGIIGTPMYMAPEQFCGRPCDHRADIYALGCLAYELLTGRHLFEAKEYFKLLEHKSTLQLPPRERIGPGISEEMFTFLERSLKHDPAHRLDSLDSIVDWAAAVRVEED